jgi:hypothetical protein
MSLSTLILAAESTNAVTLPIPTVVYGLIALVIFAALGIVLWSYRDVANRHSQKTAGGAGDHGGHGGGARGSGH